MRNIYKLSCALMFSCLSAYAQQDSAIVAKGERLLNLGYGVTVKAKESSAAISEVTGEEIMKSAATNPLNALYGKGLGLTVLQNGGTVWESVPTTMIRGLNSTRDNSILVLIDGFERDLSMITKEEIESVQILKDAAATALYGLRGANGVMLVTTKTGSKKKIDVSVNYEHHFLIFVLRVLIYPCFHDVLFIFCFYRHFLIACRIYCRCDRYQCIGKVWQAIHSIK